ncbi:MAG TPA: hypothetical protein VNJ02_00200 [Vicinamibacterales bacterium]|nr:hypothetical protein [Vicinamibacterales bacterium]
MLSRRVVLAVTIIVIGVAAIAASTQSASRAAAETELQRLETGKTWAQREGKWLTVFYQASTTNK